MFIQLYIMRSINVTLAMGASTKLSQKCQNHIFPKNNTILLKSSARSLHPNTLQLFILIKASSIGSPFGWRPLHLMKAITLHKGHFTSSNGLGQPWPTANQPVQQFVNLCQHWSIVCQHVKFGERWKKDFIYLFCYFWKIEIFNF